jgi:hypothetical protein
MAEAVLRQFQFLVDFFNQVIFRKSGASAQKNILSLGLNML